MGFFTGLISSLILSVFIPLLWILLKKIITPKINTLILVIFCINFLTFSSISVEAYTINNYHYQNESIESQTNYSIMYSEEGGQREFIVDAPWKIKEGENIPILIMIRDTDNNAYSFYNIKIYDNYDPNNPKFVKTLTISDLGLKKDGACFGDDYTTLSQHIWYYNFSLNSNLFKKNSSNSIHINTKTDGSSCGSGSDPDWSKADNGDLSIFIDNRNLPKLNKWYCGDTHYHSIYTDTYFSFWGVPLSGEFGAPIGATIDRL